MEKTSKRLCVLKAESAEDIEMHRAWDEEEYPDREISAVNKYSEEIEILEKRIVPVGSGETFLPL